MATTYDKASLVMIPSGIKESKLYSIKPTDGSGDFTFSRGTDTATRVNASGLIEKERSNQLLNSIWDGVGTNVPPTSWTNGFTSGNYESASSSFAGNTAIRFYGTAQRRYISQSPTFGGIMSLSFYVESVTTTDEVRYVVDQIGGTSLFYLEDGLVVSNSTDLVAGRTYTFVFNSTGTTEIRLGGGVTTNRTYDFTISVPQLEQGLTRTDYIETTTAAVYEGITDNLPRLDYSGGASCPSLLLEPSQTNADPNSEYLANKPIVTNVSVTTNSTTSPEGVVNASTITNNTTSGQHQLTDNTFSVTSGTDYTMSLFLKYNDAQYVRLQFGGTPFGSTNWQNFDVLNGTKGSNGGGITSADASIEDYGNGWYRCILTADATATGSNGAFQIRILEDDNTSDVPSFAGTGLSTYAYGAQFESGSYPTSYIPTYGTSASRAGDSAQTTGLGSVLGSTEGTIYLEVAALANDLGERRFALSDGTTGNVARVGFTNVSNRILAVLYNGANQCVLTYAGADITQTNKIAFTYAENDFALYVNGESRATDISGSTFAAGTLTEVHFNEGDGSGNNSFGRFDQVLVFPTRLTNAELAALTA